MNYSHHYHAGSFADVVKHILLSLLLQHLIKKENGFCYIDTHAGAGLYDLRSNQAEKTAEYKTGINLIMQERDSLPKSCTPFLNLIERLQIDAPHKLRYYPGSPSVAAHFIRPQDQLILNEKHPTIFAELKERFKRDDQVALHERDAYEFLPAIVPPKNYGRALILIDPPFEQKTELADITEALKKSLAKFPHGMYLVWLPITDKKSRLVIPHELRALLPDEKHLFIEMTVADDIFEQTGLLGSGFIIINPPWQFEQEVKPILKSLWSILSTTKQGHWRIFK